MQRELYIYTLQLENQFAQRQNQPQFQNGNLQAQQNEGRNVYAPPMQGQLPIMGVQIGGGGQEGGKNSMTQSC